jgi:hypothetical protein
MAYSLLDAGPMLTAWSHLRVIWGHEIPSDGAEETSHLAEDVVERTGLVLELFHAAFQGGFVLQYLLLLFSESFRDLLEVFDLWAPPFGVRAELGRSTEWRRREGNEESSRKECGH